MFALVTKLCVPSFTAFEKYIHGTLIYNAIKWAGFNVNAWYQMGYFGDVARCVRRYLRFQMGVA